MSEPMTAAEALEEIAALAKRCTVGNTSAGFRAHLALIIQAFVEGDVLLALQMIDDGAANIADRARVRQIRDQFPDDPALPYAFTTVDSVTHAYATLSDIRLRFGYLTLHNKSSNIQFLP